MADYNFKRAFVTWNFIFRSFLHWRLFKSFPMAIRLLWFKEWLKAEHRRIVIGSWHIYASDGLDQNFWQQVSVLWILKHNTNIKFVAKCVWYVIDAILYSLMLWVYVKLTRVCMACRIQQHSYVNSDANPSTQNKSDDSVHNKKLYIHVEQWEAINHPRP